jgi:hypothetical protein
MAITAQNQHRNDLAKAAIDASKLNADAKADLDEMLDAALAGTNGLDEAAKLDAVADNLYQVARLMCVHIAEAPRVASWRDVVIQCRREIAAVLLGLGIPLCALFALRPQIALALEHLLKR